MVTKHAKPLEKAAKCAQETAASTIVERLDVTLNASDGTEAMRFHSHHGATVGRGDPPKPWTWKDEALVDYDQKVSIARHRVLNDVLIVTDERDQVDACVFPIACVELLTGKRLVDPTQELVLADALQEIEKRKLVFAEDRAHMHRMLIQRDEARGNARILAHAFEHDIRPPARVVAESLAYPVYSTIPEEKPRADIPALRLARLEQNLEQADAEIERLRDALATALDDLRDGQQRQDVTRDMRRALDVVKHPFAELPPVDPAMQPIIDALPADERAMWESASRRAGNVALMNGADLYAAGQRLLARGLPLEQVELGSDAVLPGMHGVRRLRGGR